MKQNERNTTNWAPGEIYQALFAAYGSQNWWPGNSHFEIMVGTVLTQNTNWKNVERSISQLRAANITNMDALLAIAESELQRLIQPSGFMVGKAATLIRLCNWMISQGGISGFSNWSTALLRSELLSIKGIGEETADAILLYIFERPIPMSDAYTRRIGQRLGYFSTQVNYADSANWVSTIAPLTTLDQNEIHALLVMLGKQHCRKTKPHCEDCPLGRKCSRIGI